MAATHLDLGLRCIKYLLCAVNFLFLLTGSMIFSLSTTIYAVKDTFSHFLDSLYCSPATILIVVCGLIFVIAFLGFVGTVKESTCMVLVFAASLTIVLVLEIAASLAAFMLKDQIQSTLASKLNESMHQYNYIGEAQDAMDTLQSKLKCCGINGQDDWRGILYPNDTWMGPPDSCCTMAFENGNEICIEKFETGCISALTMVINRSALYLASGATVIALIQLTGIMFACTLGRAIRRHKTERERQRWMLRESVLSGYEQIGNVKTDHFTAYPIVYMQSENQQKPPIIS